MKYWMVGAGLIAASLAHAGPDGALPPEFPTPSDLPPTAQVGRWLDQDPGVREAASELARAEHTKGRMAASPYDWSLGFQPQTRGYDVLGGGGRSREWSAQLERPIRLPNKARIDRRLGDVEESWAEARFGEARHVAAEQLLDLWLDWLSASQNRELISEQARVAEANLAAVEKRKRAGDAAALEVNVAAGDLAAVKRDLNQVSMEVQKAQDRLKVRFPGVQETPPPLASPLSIDEPLSAWRERILETADDLKAAELEVERAQNEAARARADRMPDPTLMFYMSSESRGEEKVMGMSVKVPLPGRYHFEALGESLGKLEAVKAARDRKRHEIEMEISEAYTEATTGYQRWQLAEQAAQMTTDNGRLAQRAYELGEADLQTLLLARRQSVEATQSALEARVSALRAHYHLLIAAHQIWSLAKY